MKRSEFKKLIKECLVEVLTEMPSIGSKLQESTVVKKQSIQSNKNINTKKLVREIAGVDDVLNEFENDKYESEAMILEQINHIAANTSNGNKQKAEIMKSIFTDTVLNTLPMQKESAQGAPDLDTNGVDLSELPEFTGDMKHWANIAFYNKK